MLTSVRVIAGNLKNIRRITILNILHMILKGAPFGFLLGVILELLKSDTEVSVPRLVMLTGMMGLFMVANLWVAIKVHVSAYITSYNLCTDARLRLGDHLRKLSLGFFKKRDPGDVSALLLQDMAKVEQIFSHFFIDAVACGVLPLMVACFLISLDFRLTGLMVASVLVSLPGLWVGQKIILVVGRRHVVTRNRTAARLLEYLQGIKVLKAFNLTGAGFTRLDRIMRKLRSDSIRLEAAAAGPVIVYALILELGFMATVVLGAHYLFLGTLPLPAYCVFLVVGYKFFDPLINFGIFLSEIRYMNIAAGRVSEVMDLSPLPAPVSPEIPKTFDVAFRDVVFAYGRDPVIKGLSADFPDRQITALVGPSGSGKTTLTSLMARFWDADEGSIAIGGVDIRNIPREELNGLFAMVFQDVYLFQDTIMGNIRVGKKDATREEVIRAAKAARCHDFIEALPEGYDTLVGEGGATLSGGEKQRISIARALLKDAPIVILDEATAALDPENELLIQRAIGELVRDKTLIVIAHRLKTIAGADQILVVDGSRVRERGTHKELLASEDLYMRLWDEQQRTGGWKFGNRSREEMTEYKRSVL